MFRTCWSNLNSCIRNQSYCNIVNNYSKQIASTQICHSSQYSQCQHLQFTKNFSDQADNKVVASSHQHGHVEVDRKNNEKHPMTELLENAISDEYDDPQLPQFPSDAMDKKTKKARRRDQAKHSYRPRIDPTETTIAFFPGQGSQFVGMAKDLLKFPGVNDMFDIASSILGYDLLDVCVNGPKAKLDRTVYCQPAILVTSLAAIERLREDNPVVCIHGICKSFKYCIASIHPKLK